MSRVCLRCRFLLDAGERCDDAHEIVALGDSKDRAQLRSAVWGDQAPSHGDGTLRSALGFSVAMAGVIAATFTGLALLVSLADKRLSMLSPGPWIVIAGLTLPLALAVGWEILDGDGVRLWWPHRIRPPRGAPVTAAAEAPIAARGPARGVAITAPLSGTPCVAWSVTLAYDGAIVLRAARTAGLTIADGERDVEVPAGRVAVVAHRRRISRRAAKRWLPAEARGDLVPFTDAWEDTVVDGDLVEIVGEVAPAPTGYRDAAAWRAIAPITLRRC